MKRGLAKTLAAGGTLLALGGTAYAADQIAGRDRAPASSAVTISSSAPLFQEAGLVGGQTFDRCTVLTNEGPQPADVTLFGTASEAALSPWLDLELVRGSLPDGTPAGDCTGFVADTENYGESDPGVIFRGTLDTLPDADSGIADPTRWAVGERHAYLLRVHYTGDDPQQGLQTVQNFSWGVTPFDDRPPDPYVDPGTTTPLTATPASADGDVAGDPAAPSALGRACTVVSFPSRSFIGARAITRPKLIKKKTKAKAKKALAALGTTASDVVAAGEDLGALGATEAARRARLLKKTRATAAKQSPVLVVRLAPTKDERVSIRVGLRKNGKLQSPKRWQWVRVRMNRSATKSTLRWPFTASADMKQMKIGYNQLDLTLNRGKDRPKGLPGLWRRSFAFIVGQPGKSKPGGADCTLG